MGDDDINDHIKDDNGGTCDDNTGEDFSPQRAIAKKKEKRNGPRDRAVEDGSCDSREKIEENRGRLHVCTNGASIKRSCFDDSENGEKINEPGRRRIQGTLGMAFRRGAEKCPFMRPP